MGVQNTTSLRCVWQTKKKSASFCDPRQRVSANPGYCSLATHSEHRRRVFSADETVARFCRRFALIVVGELGL